MAVSQYRSNQKQTGAKYKELRKKRKCDLGRLPTYTKLGEKSIKTLRTLGSNEKLRVLRADAVNVYDKKEKKSFVVKIKTVLENPANRHFVRRNIITKGTIVDTEKGKVRITSRPGQDGTVNGILV
jgi:small subunit ribosomal protein S8e